MTLNWLAMMLVCSFLLLSGGISALGQDQPMSGSSQDQGAQLYQSHCAYCHGADGRGGRGPAIATLPGFAGGYLLPRVAQNPARLGLQDVYGIAGSDVELRVIRSSPR